MIKVVVTGGIGSGKTFICSVFKNLGIPIFHADTEARTIMNKNKSIINQIKHTFGADIYLKNDVLDRKKLANIVFNDSFALENLNQIVHPEVRRSFKNWSSNQQSYYVIQESAIVFENNQITQFDKIITVTAPLKVRVKRIIERNNINKEEVLARINNQVSDAYKVKHSDYVIFNDGKTMILPQIIEIHKRLIEWQNLENG